MPRHQREGGKQHERADHDVAIDRDHPADRRHVEQLGPVQPRDAAKAHQHQCQAGNGADQFAADRAPGHALDPPAEMEAEPDRQRDVGAVEDHLQKQTERPLATAEHVAENRVVEERQRRREHADTDIGSHGVGDTRFRIDEPCTGERDQRSEQDEHHARRQRDHRGAPEHRLFLARVIAPEGLRHQAGRARAQEVERREDHVENDRAGGEAAEQGGVAELSHDRCVNEAEHRRRQIGERHRHRDGERQAVGHLERPALGRHVGLVLHPDLPGRLSPRSCGPGI